MDMLFSSKTPKCSDPPERLEFFRNFEDQLHEVKQLVLDLHGQFASFQESISTSLREIKSEFQAFREQQRRRLSHSLNRLRREIKLKKSSVLPQVKVEEAVDLPEPSQG